MSFGDDNSTKRESTLLQHLLSSSQLSPLAILVFAIVLGALQERCGLSFYIWFAVMTLVSLIRYWVIQKDQGKASDGQQLAVIRKRFVSLMSLSTILLSIGIYIYFPQEPESRFLLAAIVAAYMTAGSFSLSADTKISHTAEWNFGNERITDGFRTNKRATRARKHFSPSRTAVTRSHPEISPTTSILRGNLQCHTCRECSMAR